MPFPAHGEKLSDYIKRGMQDSELAGKTRKQKLGWLYGVWREHHKSKHARMGDVVRFHSSEQDIASFIQGLHDHIRKVGKPYSWGPEGTNHVIGHEGAGDIHPVGAFADMLEESGKPNAAHLFRSLLDPSSGASIASHDVGPFMNVSGHAPGTVRRPLGWMVLMDSQWPTILASHFDGKKRMELQFPVKGDDAHRRLRLIHQAVQDELQEKVRYSRSGQPVRFNAPRHAEGMINALHQVISHQPNAKATYSHGDPEFHGFVSAYHPSIEYVADSLRENGKPTIAQLMQSASKSIVGELHNRDMGMGKPIEPTARGWHLTWAAPIGNQMRIQIQHYQPLTDEEKAHLDQQSKQHGGYEDYVPTHRVLTVDHEPTSGYGPILKNLIHELDGIDEPRWQQLMEIGKQMQAKGDPSLLQEMAKHGSVQMGRANGQQQPERMSLRDRFRIRLRRAGKVVRFLKPVAQQTLSGALELLGSSNHKVLSQTVSRILNQMGMRPHTVAPVLHDTTTEVKPSVAAAIFRPTTPEAVRYAASWHGLLTRTPAVLAFQPGDGPDSLYSIHINGSGDQIHQQLNAAGVGQRVLIPSKGGFDISIYDQGRQQRAQVSQFARSIGTQVGESRGKGDVVGAATGDEGRADQRKVIRRVEGQDNSQMQRLRDRIRLRFHHHRGATMIRFAKPTRISQLLRLKPQPSEEQPNMHVISGGQDVLHNLASGMDDKALDKVHYAVVKRRGKPDQILLHHIGMIPSEALMANAQAYKQHRQLTNLMIPHGQKLNPNLRTDALRKAFGVDNDKLVWLQPGEDGKFTPAVINKSALKPLRHAVEHVTETPTQSRTPWYNQTDFSFDPFRVEGDQPEGDQPQPKPVAAGPGPAPTKALPVARSQPADPRVETPQPVPEMSAYVPASGISDQEKGLRDHLAHLENQFHDLGEQTDSPQHEKLWAQMADVNSRLGRTEDAGLSWANHLWGQKQTNPEAAKAWLHSQQPNAEQAPDPNALAQMPPAPTVQDMRAQAARIAWYANTPTGANILRAQAPAVSQHLQKNEDLLDPRSAWLAWHNLSQATGDTLGEVRARDRILERLLSGGGLRRDRDLPSFLRHLGKDAERTRSVSAKTSTIHDLAQKWGQEHQVNAPYLSKVFAHALASMGETEAARQLHEKSTHPQVAANDVHRILGNAYAYRIKQAAEGRPANDPLPPDVLNGIQGLLAGNDKQKTEGYILNQARSNSRILEPSGGDNPYKQYLKSDDPLAQELTNVAKISDPAELGGRISLLLNRPLDAQQKLNVLTDTLPLASKVGEHMVMDVLRQVPDALASTRSGATPAMQDRQKDLLKNAIIMAGNYGQSDMVGRLADEFGQSLAAKSGKDAASYISGVSRDVLRSLRKFGMSDHIQRFLTQATDKILGAGEAKEQTPDQLSSLLAIAEGWYSTGHPERAQPLVDMARAALFSQKPMKDQDYAKLAGAYASALGQATVEQAIPAMEHLFANMRKLPNSYTSAPYFSRHHLGIAEDAARALASENLATGGKLQKIMDENEYNIRRRIHQDTKAAMERGTNG